MATGCISTYGWGPAGIIILGDAFQLFHPAYDDPICC